MILVSADPGLNGGLCRIDSTTNQLTVIRMPTRTIIDRPAFEVFARDANDKKVIIKSGPNKGTYKKIIKNKAKTHKELDLHAISTFLEGADEFVTESPAMSFGNSSKSTASTNRNYGKLLAVAELLSIPTVPVTPAQWKKALDLGRDKLVAIAYTESILTHYDLNASQTTFTNTEDGLAESIALSFYYKPELFKALS